MALQRLARSTKSNVADASAVTQRYALRSALRPIGLDVRQRCCGASVASAMGAALLFSGSPGTWKTRWSGIMTCGKVWTCPVCAAKRRAEQLARATLAMRLLSGRWQMMTLTIRHHQGDAVAPLLRGLMLALARMRRQGGVKKIWARAVTASIRATEVTFGANGWHPHLHVLFRLKQLTSEERRVIRHAWRRAVTRELGEDHAPVLSRGVRLSKSLDVERTKPDKLAGYLCKLGCEIVGEAKLARKDGSLSSWDVARLASKRCPREWHAWSDFQTATKGRRMLELDDRAARAVKGLPISAVLGFGVEVDCHDDSPAVETRTLDVTHEELRALRRCEFFDGASLARPMLAARTAHDPVAAASEIIRAAVERARSRDGPPDPVRD